MFSEMCDDVVQRSGRKDRLLNGDIPAYANAAMKELQAGQFFYKDGVEDTVSISTIDPTIWTYPAIFRKLRTAQYPDLTYPDQRMPGRGQKSYMWNDLKGFYYAASNYIVFSNVAGTVTAGGSNLIKLYYYTWVPRLKYYAVAQRPATFDDILQTWTYSNQSANPDPDNNLDYTQVANQPIAQARVANWMLMNYREFIAEGTLAKLFKAIKDETRAIQSYSLWGQYKKDIERTEAFESLEV